ncbi:uncharacterized protein LOC144436851 [Glandiceps talaboti]
MKTHKYKLIGISVLLLIGCGIVEFGLTSIGGASEVSRINFHHELTSEGHTGELPQLQASNDVHKMYTSNVTSQVTANTGHYTNATIEAKSIYNRYGFVNVQFLNLGFLNITKSWICNVECLGIISSTLFIVNDIETHRQLTSWNPQLNVVLESFGTSDSMKFGQAQYHRHGLFRAKVVNELLKHGISVFKTEADAVWFGNPIDYFRRYNNTDFIVMHDKCSKMKPSQMLNGGFLYLNATLGTKAVWNELIEQVEKALDLFADTAGDKIIGDAANDQLKLTNIISKRRASVHVEWLPIDLYVSGIWYNDEVVRKQSHPTVILNNYIIGNKSKENRAKKEGHWFLSNNDTCMPCQQKTT